MKNFLKNEINIKLDNYEKKYTQKKSILKLILWLLKQLFISDKLVSSSFKDDQIHLLIHALGAVGDLIFISKYIRALKTQFNDLIIIDILLAEKNYQVIGKNIFNCLPINQVHFEVNTTYDCELFILNLPEIKFMDEMRFRKNKFKTFYEYLIKLSQFSAEYGYMYNDDYARINYSLIHKRHREDQSDIYDLLNMASIKDHFISLPEKAISSQFLSKLNLQEDLYITVQTGGGKWMKKHSKLDTRAWDINNYNELVLKLKEKFPAYKFVQIGDEYQSEIKHVDCNLLGKTNFDELKILLKYAKLHISQEGGMPILRHFLSRKTSCVLFGPSNINFLKFPENINISANLGCNCEGLIKEWVKKCDLYDKPLCMQKISSDQCFLQIKEFLLNDQK